MGTKENSTNKIITIILFITTLVSASWAACATIVAADVKRIDDCGTKAMGMLEKRVTTLEVTLNTVLPTINKSLEEIKDDVKGLRGVGKFDGAKAMPNRDGNS